MKERLIRTVEDGPDDEEFTLVGLTNSVVLNDIYVVRDGAEARRFVFVQGK